MNTIQLSPAWDLTLDANGNLAMATGPGAIAQDVASAISLFAGELLYDTSQGLPYLSEVFGPGYAPALVRSLLEQAALAVPGVVQAQASITAFNQGQISGSIRVIDQDGQAIGVHF